MQSISCRDMECRIASSWAYPWQRTWRSCVTQALLQRMWILLSIDSSLDPWCTSSQDVDSTLYRQLIGSLMYLVHTRLDICYTVNALRQFMSDPKHIHWVAAKHVLIYVRGTITYGLRYTSSSGVLLAGYADSDWAGSAVDQKSTSSYCFSMESAMISWSSKNQGSIA